MSKRVQLLLVVTSVIVAVMVLFGIASTHAVASAPSANPEASRIFSVKSAAEQLLDKRTVNVVFLQNPASSTTTTTVSVPSASFSQVHRRSFTRPQQAPARVVDGRGRRITTAPTDSVGLPQSGAITDSRVEAMRRHAAEVDSDRFPPPLKRRPHATSTVANVAGHGEAPADSEEPRFKIGVVSLNARTSTGSRAVWMHEHAAHNKMEYCKKWGYDLIIEDNDIIDRSRDVAWSKIPIFKKWLPKYDYLMWVDMDAFFMRFDLPIEHLIIRTTSSSSEAKDVILAKDFNGINFGVFLFRRSPFVFQLMDDMWNTPRIYWQPWEEQSALMRLLDFKKTGIEAKRREHHFDYVMQRDLNSYPQQFAYGNLDALFQDGDFIAHFPNCKAFHNCQQVIQRFYEMSCRYNGVQTLEEQGAERSQIPQRIIPSDPPVSK